MDYKFLHRVIDQLVYETKIDFDEKKIYFPFSYSSFSLSFVLSFSSFLSPSNFFITSSSYFVDHCREIYGLTDDEVGYVFEEYKDIIKDKIESNG